MIKKLPDHHVYDDEDKRGILPNFSFIARFQLEIIYGRWRVQCSRFMKTAPGILTLHFVTVFLNVLYLLTGYRIYYVGGFAPLNWQALDG